MVRDKRFSVMKSGAHRSVRHLVLPGRCADRVRARQPANTSGLREKRRQTTGRSQGEKCLSVPRDITTRSVRNGFRSRSASGIRQSGWTFGKGAWSSLLPGGTLVRPRGQFCFVVGHSLRAHPEKSRQRGSFSVVAEIRRVAERAEDSQRTGGIFIADQPSRGLLVLDPTTGKVEVLVERVRREGLKGLNDLIFAPER